MTQVKRGLDVGKRLVLAHGDIGFAALASRYFHRRGWSVYLAKTGAEARRLTALLRPAVVVLATDLPDESGWLLSEKLTCEEPSPKVILIADRPKPEYADFADFVGAAALVLRSDGISALLHEVGEAALPAAS